MKQDKTRHKKTDDNTREMESLREAQLKQSLNIMNDLLNSGARQHIVKAVQQSLESRKQQR